jgi:hypothetical protein
MSELSGGGGKSGDVRHGATKRLAFAIVLWLLALPGDAGAHPPVSVVMDSRGNLYFSDLENVRVLRPDGSIEIVVRNVHTHELWIGPDDALYGEDVVNRGDEYRHRVWMRSRDGTIEDVIPWRDGFPDEFHDYAFQRDGSGAEYVLRRGSRSIEVRNPSGQVARTIDLDSTRGFVHWLTVAPDGRVFVSIGSDVLRIGPGRTSPELLASGLVERTESFDWVQDRHSLMGMWTDTSGSVYVAVFSGQVVKRVDPDGSVSVAARSEGNWSPVGGRIGPDGSMYVLEWSGSNQARIREIEEGGVESIIEVG